MKKPTVAPAYVGVYVILSKIARRRGYALAIHGSVSRDFDLVAIPWTETAVDAETLIRAIAEAISWRIEGSVDYVMKITEQKLHGRRSWAIPIEGGAVLDISVMPRSKEPRRRLMNLDGNEEYCRNCNGTGIVIPV